MVLADQAILYPQRRSPAYADLNRQADVVRDALRDVEQGEDTGAVERLSEIPRRSPFAEWRLFVRGLIAHYADDLERVEANWSRLEPSRAACRIATNLQVFSGRLKAQDCSIDVATGQRRLLYAVTGSPVISQLETIRDHFQAGQIQKSLSALRAFRQRYGQSRRRLLERLTDLMWKRLASQGDDRILRQLIKTVPGPPLDPNWNRARAVLWHESDSGNMNRMEDLWTAYIRDLEQCEALSEDERKIAASLVHQRIAGEFAHAARIEEDRDEPDGEFWDDDDFDDYQQEQEEYVEILRQRAEVHLQDALRTCPKLLEAHRDLVSLYQDADQPQKAIDAARHLVQHFPDHFETLLWLANYFIEADKPADAESYVDRVSRLRPRDPAVQSLIWHQRLGMLRQLARKRQFDAARQQLQEAFVARPENVKSYLMDLLQATIEYKAKNIDAAENHLQAAVGAVEEPTVIWLIMHAYADRFGLDRKLKNDFRDRYKSAILRGCTSQTAGHIAGFLRDFLVRRVKYSGLVTHQRLFVTYLNRSKKVAWEHEDLRAVCDFVRRLEGQQGRALRCRLATEGLRRFPDDPLFPYLCANEMLFDAPYRRNYSAMIDHWERALELNKTAELRLSDEDIEDAKRNLSAAQTAREMMGSIMGRFAEFLGGGFMLGEEYDDEDEDEDDWYEEEDEDDDDQSQGWGSGRRPHQKSSGSGKNQRFFPF